MAGEPISSWSFLCASETLPLTAVDTGRACMLFHFLHHFFAKAKLRWIHAFLLRWVQHKMQQVQNYRTLSNVLSFFSLCSLWPPSAIVVYTIVVFLIVKKCEIAIYHQVCGLWNVLCVLCTGWMERRTKPFAAESFLVLFFMFALTISEIQLAIEYSHSFFVLWIVIYISEFKKWFPSKLISNCYGLDGFDI